MCSTLVMSSLPPIAEYIPWQFMSIMRKGINGGGGTTDVVSRMVRGTVCKYSDVLLA